LPKSITKDANNNIIYTYNVSGEKGMQAKKLNGTAITRYYADLFEYDKSIALKWTKGLLIKQEK
jgi:hypothetical protein